MKPTENTFLLSINAMRRRKQPPNEKVELLESPESFELFDKFVRGVRVAVRRGSHRPQTHEGKWTPFSQQSRAVAKGVVPLHGSFLGERTCGVNDRVIFLGCCSLAYATIGVTK